MASNRNARVLPDMAARLAELEKRNAELEAQNSALQAGSKAPGFGWLEYESKRGTKVADWHISGDFWPALRITKNKAVALNAFVDQIKAIAEGRKPQ